MTLIKKKITVIGGGVSGISCALLLQKLGFETEVISKDPLLPSKPNDPKLVSSFPAASVIPHSIEHHNLNTLFRNSLFFFEKLFSENFKGLGKHLHYELFAHKEEVPKYAPLMHKFELLDESSIKNAPSHPSIPTTFGFKSDCFFADWAIYFPDLIDAYLAVGGKVSIKKLCRKDLQFLDSEIIINCTEFGGPELAGEKFDPIISKGHILHINDVPKLKNKFGKTVSYNFVPGFDHYHTENGTILDVYCYSRENRLVLGGSRLTGTLSEHDEWIGEKVTEPSVEVDGVTIPEQILSINQDIIKFTFGIDVRSFPRKQAYAGYRFMGNKEPGLKLETEDAYDRLIIHNYGHGGAGVTVSWGCAFEVASIIFSKLRSSSLDLEKALSVI
ncbi:MAG: FAD-binding oxidoreductase [Balneolaceae bacterium]|nr:FAD-binding oxidoreductase [Balneolaceae bacterium]MBO6547198.1 FAD-binding oxidoreductase [Balneolaceae bacterium]MBO6647855.1 FAD-binding oxidoreductase [Balneolaceae bacterium]